MSEQNPSADGADPKRRRPDHDEATAEAQARLDQIREEGGMARRGDELAARRSGEKDDHESAFSDPPLDWRLTPYNIVMQLAAVALFIGVVWYLVSLVIDSWSAFLQ